MKKIFKGCAIIAVVAIFFVALLGYLTFRPRYKDASNHKPFSDIVQKRVSTKRAVILVDDESSLINDSYSYSLEDGTMYGLNSNLKTVLELPVGTQVYIDKAELHTGSVSGTTSAYLFGKFYDSKTNKEYSFQYNWGYYHSIYEDKPYWTFKKGFWQTASTDQKFYISKP